MSHNTKSVNENSNYNNFNDFHEQSVRIELETGEKIFIRSYRSIREAKAYNLRQKELRDHWDSTPNQNYPYRKTNIEVKKNTVKEKRTDRELKIIHWNANGIVGKIVELSQLIAIEHPDVVSINETKTNTTTCAYLYNIRGYFPYIKNRDGNGGGVALLIKENLISESIKLPENISTIEAVGALLKLEKQYLSIFSYYNPPKNNTVNEDFINFIENQGDYILIGDLNAKMSAFGDTNNKGRSLERILMGKKGEILNNKGEPTFFKHVKDNLVSSSTIDLVLANDSLAAKKINIETMPISPVVKFQKQYYHLPIKCTFSIERKCKKERTSFHASFLYDKAKWDVFKSEQDSIIAENFTDLTLEEKAANVTRAYKIAAEKGIPKSKENLLRENFPPAIKDVLNLRNFWAKKFRKDRSQSSASSFKEMELLANELISDFRHEQWNKFLERQGKSPLSSVPFWKRINRLRECKRRKKIESLLLDGIEINSDKDKAKIFAETLEKKFSDTGDPNFDENHKRKIDDFINSGEFESNYSREQKRVPEFFTYYELQKELKNMNSKTSLDHLGITNKMIKHSSDKMKSCLLELFNDCLAKYKLPKDWKTSMVSMIAKPGLDARIISSYRPISITPCLARLVERLLLSRLQKHLKRNNIIIMNQSGFRKNRQTKDNILYLIQTAQEGFNKGEKTLTVFFDVAAAFDKVWHNGLLAKLVELKVPYYLVKMIKEFLSERLFFVKVEADISDLKSILCGVPQGAVLSPTLFKIYINNLPIRKSQNEMTLLFADDIVYTLRFNPKKNGHLEAENKANIYMKELESWMNIWRLTLAPKKCSQILFSKMRNKNDDLCLKLYDEPIKVEENPKFLGIVFDKKLNF
jgi:exonuclease III